MLDPRLLRGELDNTARELGRRGVKGAGHTEMKQRMRGLIKLKPKLFAPAVHGEHVLAGQCVLETGRGHTIEDNMVLGTAHLGDRSTLCNRGGQSAAALHFR